MKKTLFIATGVMLVTFMVQAAEHLVGSHTVTGMPATTEAVKPDNTQVNKRDRGEQTLTPLDQSNTKADTKITQAIRKSIMKQKLSMNAKNIKVITQSGAVTLRGPVNTRAELETIARLAKAVPGVKTLTNELEVK